MMQRDDLLKHTHLWVWGCCAKWNSQAQQFADEGGMHFTMFVANTHKVVWRYLHGKQTLDGTCSDFECTIALEAKQVFGPHLETQS